MRGIFILILPFLKIWVLFGIVQWIICKKYSKYGFILPSLFGIFAFLITIQRYRVLLSVNKNPFMSIQYALIHSIPVVVYYFMCRQRRHPS